MFDQILQEVKQHLGKDPNVASKIPPEHAEEVHREVAQGVSDGLKEQATGGGLGGMVSSLTGGGGGADSLIPKITKAVSERLNGKFGLSPQVIQSISGAIPGILEKFTR